MSSLFNNIEKQPYVLYVVPSIEGLSIFFNRNMPFFLFATYLDGVWRLNLVLKGGNLPYYVETLPRFDGCSFSSPSTDEQLLAEIDYVWDNVFLILLPLMKEANERVSEGIQSLVDEKASTILGGILDDCTLSIVQSYF